MAKGFCSEQILFSESRLLLQSGSIHKKSKQDVTKVVSLMKMMDNCKISREMLKTEVFGLAFQDLPQNTANVKELKNHV